MEPFETNGSAAEGWRVRADYDVRYIAPTTMEPQTCTAHIIDGRAQIWAPGQDGEGTLRTDAKAMQVDPSAVTFPGRRAPNIQGGLYGR